MQFLFHAISENSICKKQHIKDEKKKNKIKQMNDKYNRIFYNEYILSIQ